MCWKNNGLDHGWFGISGCLPFGGPGDVSIDNVPVPIEGGGEERKSVVSSFQQQTMTCPSL